MSAQPNAPAAPRTPIRNAEELPLINDPFSAGSTLTSLSSLSESSGKSSSPSRSWPLKVNLRIDTTPNRNERRVDLNENTPRAVTQRSIHPEEAGDPLKHLLTPQKALPAKMTLVPDRSPSRLHFPLASLTAPPSTLPRASSELSSSSSEQEIWVKDPGRDLEWPEDELDDFMHCLKEEGLVKCHEEYVIEKGYSLPRMLSAFGKKADPNASEDELEEKLLTVMRQALRNRERIGNYGSVNHAVQLLRRAKNIMIITGAGISVSCGIKDFRSRDGIYATIKQSGQYDDLDDPQQMFSLKEFVRRPSMFYSFIGQLWPQDVKPSITHEFIKLLETDGRLLRNYTQNIDSLEVAAGVERVFHCHGSFKKATCMDCGKEVPGSEIMTEVLSCKVPQCAPCVQKEASKPATRAKPKPKPKKKKGKKSGKSWDDDDSEDDMATEKLEKIVGVMKPSITFFGEKLHSTFDDQVYLDRDQVDLLLIIGSSMKVKPVSEISAHIPHSIPQILINREPVPHANVDIALLGDCDRIIEHLCYEAGWVLPSQQNTPRQSRKKRRSEDPVPSAPPQQMGNSHIWVFDGADKSKARTYAQKYDPSFKPPRLSGKQNASRQSDPLLRDSKRRRLS